MRVAISGAHSQGKTTLINDLKFTEEFRKFKLMTNLTRGIKDLGVEINEKGSDWSQYLVMAKHIEHYFTPGNLLLDRCALDGVAYTAALYEIGKVSLATLHHAECVARGLLTHEKYDLVFYVVPELPLTNDGVRTIDVEFFNMVVRKFEGYISYYGMGFESGSNLKVVYLKGLREERVKTVINTFKSL